MNIQSATITSKLQFTIPAAIARSAGIKSGIKVHVAEENGRIIITPLKKIIEELAGCLSAPKNFKNKNLDKIIKESKIKYFSSRKP